MSISPVQVGQPNDVIWGTNGVFATGRIVSGGQTTAVKVDDNLNNDGVPTGAILIPEKLTFDFEMELEANVTYPNAGWSNVNILSIANCVVESSALSYRRGSRATVKITAFGFPS
jgi:hypothetical protein